MNEMEAKEEIRVIREMLEKTRRSAADSGTFFLAWGFLIILAVIGNYALAFAEKYSWIWLNWILFPGIGVIFSCLYWGRKEKKSGMKTYASTAAGYLGIGCGVAFIFVGLVLPAFKVYSWGVIALLVSAVWGTYLFTVGGIFDWALLKWCGIISWAVAFGMIFIDEKYRALVFIPLILIGCILPGFIMRSQYRKEPLSQ